MLGDGAISLGVEEVDSAQVRCRVLTGGFVQGRPGVHLPSERLRLTTPTDDDLVFGAAMIVTAICAHNIAERRRMRALAVNTFTQTA